jgi:hypothetical protein
MKILKSTLLTLILILSNSIFLTAQDTTETDEDWEWEWDEVEEFSDWKLKQPTINLIYGLSDIKRTDVEAPFADNNLLELKLGYTRNKTSRYADFIEKHTFNYLFLNKNSTELAGETDITTDIETNNWQFGLGWSGGYGYKVESEALIIPYYSSMMTWTTLDFADDSLSANDESIKELYDESIRFGSGMEAGVRVNFTKMIAIEGGYERTIVFQRHLFWKWAGSAIIELAAQGLLDTFIKEIFKSSPSVGPVVNMILKGALGYGLYELRQEKMNWPFPSAPPIAMDNVKFGVTFVF